MTALAAQCAAIFYSYFKQNYVQCLYNIKKITLLNIINSSVFCLGGKDG